MAKNNKVSISKLISTPSSSGTQSISGKTLQKTQDEFEALQAKKNAPQNNTAPIMGTRYDYAAENGLPNARQRNYPASQSAPRDNAEILGLQNQLNSLMSMMGQQNQYQSAMEARINALNEAKKAQAVADLGRARDTQLSNIASEEAGIKPMYDNKRNATAASNMMGRRTLAEELAARGEVRSGVADQANINANMSLQSGLGALNNQEASDVADIARRRTGIANAYESDVASAKAGLEAATMQNLINQYNTDRQFKLSEAGVTGTYNGNQTIDALNAARNYALNEAGLTGTYNGSPTLTAQNQTFNQNMATKQYDQDLKQQKLDNLYRQQTFDYAKSRDAVSDSQWQKSMNLDLRQQTFQEAQANISNALSRGRIAQEDAAQALQWAKFNAEQDPDSLDNQYKRAQINSIYKDANNNAYPTVSDYATQIEATYTQQPSSANGYKKTINTTGVKSYIDQLILAGIPETITDQLASKYGIQ